MVSSWWLVGSFLMGGVVGYLVTALQVRRPRDQYFRERK